MAAYQEFNFLSSAARTATGESPSITTFSLEVPEGGDMRLYLNCSAASGTSPTLNVSVVAIIGGIEYALASFAQLTSSGKESIVVTGCPANVKIKYTIGGTSPSFTFRVDGHRI